MLRYFILYPNFENESFLLKYSDLTSLKKYSCKDMSTAFSNFPLVIQYHLQYGSQFLSKHSPQHTLTCV